MPQLQPLVFYVLSSSVLYSTLLLPYIGRIARSLEIVTILIMMRVAVSDCAQSTKLLFRFIKKSCLRGENLETLHRSSKTRVEERVVALENQHEIGANVRRRKCDDFELS